MGELFGVEVRQTVRCHGCGTSFRRTERSDGLMLPLPEEEEGAEEGGEEEAEEAGKGERGEGEGEERSELSLEQCLAASVAPQQLSGGDQFHCDRWCAARLHPPRSTPLHLGWRGADRGPPPPHLRRSALSRSRRLPIAH